ncbi:class I SAM-dependent methyltransferase [Pseudonocardiaceae bacterium YIM PH 21723]|nr:class I SAM-dependent methyltransferase [Pseudonocardiaceae bacterium YIM PH 21723]
MIYESPLGYLLGLEGLALLRAFTGEHDQGFTDARIAEIRRLLDDPALAGVGVQVDRVGTVDGYRAWAPTYDQPGNGAFALDEPEVVRILDPLPPGVALDAACGTGRYSRLLADRGHRVIGVDSSPDMLAHAGKRVPDGRFLTGDLHDLPVGAGEVDLVVCGLALAHVSRLDPVFAEFARVLRPGGHVVIADMHPESVARGANPTLRGADGRPGRMISTRHLIGDYLRAALAAGMQVRDCREVARPAIPDGPAATDPGPWDVWPWSLAAMVPEAARAASGDAPAIVVWHFQLAG